VHPKFYPRPVSQREGSVFAVVTRDPNPLPQKELLRLYNKCGEVLHRGSLKDLLSELQTPTVIHYPDITELTQKVYDLLADHIVSMLDGNSRFLCIFGKLDDNSRIQVGLLNTYKICSLS
jgi:hypothetical protein